MNLKAVIAYLLITLATNGLADTVQLRSDHPQSYTVVKDDTLWDIARHFLTDPWKWPQIWEVNPQIRNPDLIYPGDILNLVYINGQPRIRLSRGGGHRNGKLQPRIRESRYDEAIYVIPVNAIRQFLSKPKIVEVGQLENAPYVVDFADDHILGGAGDRIYVRGIADDAFDGYHVFRSGTTYKDPDSDEVLGHEAIYVAETRFQRTGDPSTLFLTATDREVIIGDRLLAIEQEVIDFRYEPRIPDAEINGHLISVYDGVSQIGQYNIVAIDRGARDGLSKGHLLDIYRSGRRVRDIVTKNKGEMVSLPEERSGQLMVFKTFEKISYGLVTSADYHMHIYDAVKTP